MLQDGKPRLKPLVDICKGMRNVCTAFKDKKNDMKKFMDSQASLIAVIQEGGADVCARLDMLESKIDQGFDAVIGTIHSTRAADKARELRIEQDLVIRAHNEVVEDMIHVAESEQLPPRASERASIAEQRADRLYFIAKSSVPASKSDQAALSKQDKLVLMPYIIAMAYATRVKVDARMITSLRDGPTELQRCQQYIDEFAQVLRNAIEAIVYDVSLLEVALDYYLPLAAYLNLYRGLGTQNELPSSGARVWEDGLAGIRSVFHHDVRGGSDTIQLNNEHESMWWQAFASSSTSSSTGRKTAISVHELCYVLGAVDADAATASLRFAPGPCVRSPQPT